MNFITKPLSNTNVDSDKLQIVKSKKKIEKTDFFCNCTYFVRMALLLCHIFMIFASYLNKGIYFNLVLTLFNVLYKIMKKYKIEFL